MSGAATALTPARDPELLRRLRRMRRIATALLAAMAALFVATLAWPNLPGAAVLRAFAEAAVIGGLADWFAVTALFRRPLGLPIPHTAIVRRRKNDIGRALARFIGENFLVREAVERRLDRSNLAQRFGAWLNEADYAERLAADLAAGLHWVASEGEASELRAALGRDLRAAFDDVPVGKAVAALLDLLASGSRADALIDQLVGFGRAELENHRVLIRVRIHEQSPWWLPKFVDQEIYDKLMLEIETLLDDIARDPKHPARHAIVGRLAALKTSLAEDPELAAKSREIQQAIADHPAVRDYANELWGRLGDELRAQLAAPDSALRAGLAREIRHLGATLRADERTATRLNDWLKQALLYVVEQYREPLTEIVSDTIESWDAAETADRLELHIGTDLQYIRVNGTLVGGLIGLAIYFAAALSA
jgi:uncharacterized membrane-anchored protein YjiN (DUF445 family)